MLRSIALVALVLALPLTAPAAGAPLLDPSGGSHGSVSFNLAKGQITLRIAGLAPLPADVSTGAGTYTATVYKAYANSSTDPALEIFLTDVYPNARQKTKRKVALGGDVGRLGLNRITVTAFSKDAQQSSDVLTATIAP